MAYVPYVPPTSGGEDSHIYSCDSVVSVGSLVAISSSGSILVLANAATIEGRAVGVVTEKPTNNQAKISQFHVVEGLTGIIPKQTYFLHTISGIYTTTPPNTPNSFVQIIGEGLSTTALQVTIDPTEQTLN